MRSKSAVPSNPTRGSTTRTKSGLHRKTVYFDDIEWEAIRRRAFEQDSAYTDVVREAVRKLLSIKV
jgi:hypothetical protein